MMKKIMIVFFTPLFCLGTFCQTEEPVKRGNFIAGGALSFDSKTLETNQMDLLLTTNSNSIEVSPNLSYFVIDKLALGIQLSSIFTTTKYLPSNIRVKSSKFILAPIIRYYIYSGCFSEASVGYGKISYSSEEGEGQCIRGKISLGYSFFVNNNISLEPVLSLSRYKENWDKSITNDTESKSNEFNFSLCLQTFF